MGYAVGRLAQCLGIPYVQLIWEYVIVNLVVDFKFGEGLHRRSRWDDLNEIFQNAVKQGYTTGVRCIKEEQASDSGRPEYRGAGNIPNDDLSTDDDEISICEMMPDIWKYAAPRDLEVSAVREASPLNNVRVHNSINGQYAIRPKMVDTLNIRPPRQLPPSDQQDNRQTKRGGTSYEYCWTGM